MAKDAGKFNFLDAKGEMSELFRKTDWAANPLGTIETWPQSLKTAVSIMLNSKFPMFISWGRERTFLYNEAYSSILGQKHPAALGSPFETVWKEIWSDIEPLVMWVDRGESVYLENLQLILNRSGCAEETYFTFSYSPLRDEGDSICGLFCAVVETTGMVRAQASLLKSEAGLKFALEAGQMGTWTVDLKKSSVQLSDDAKKLFGFSPDASDLNHELESVIHPDDQEKASQDLLHAIETNSFYQSEYRIVRPSDHEIRWILAKGQARVGSDGEVDLMSGVITDITERKRNEEALRVAKLEAERANKSKSAFLANMSHEIRTPMSAVLGFAEILRDPSLTEADRKEALERIDSSGRALLRVIDDILDISKVEAGKLSVVSSRFSPLEVVSEVTALLRLQAEQKGIRLLTTIESSVPEIACADSSRLRQILTNLIGNAVKFTSKGEVIVSVRAERESQCLIFEISDTGIGIADADQSKLFQSFEQADNSISRRYGGTGLGLVLSQHLAEAMHGQLRLIKSRVGEGSCFGLTIKAGPFDYFKVHDMFSSRDAEGASLANTKVLVVDDVSDNQILMKRYLESAGAEVDFASDGEEAIAKALNREFDVVLMDIQMPVVDGIQATKRLRARGYSGPILALTAHAIREEIDRSIQAGCNAHLTKPVTKTAIISAVSKFVQN